MKREDSKPASDSRTMTRKISHKNLSDGYISLMDAQQTKQLWSMACPKASISEADIENYIPLPYQIQQEVDESESEPELVFGRSISEDVLTQPQSLSESVVKIMTQTAKHNSDAILALPKIRDLLMEDVGHLAEAVTHIDRVAQEELCGRGGVKRGKTRTPVEELVQDKYYEGQIVKRTRAGLLIDINATGLGLLRWRLLRGVPRNLQKIGGFLANLVVSKVDQGRFSLKLHTIGFHKETMEETDYQHVHECVHHWSGLPGLPGCRNPEVPEGLPEFPEAKAVRVVASREERLRRQGKMGPRF